jgi:hypothetical protein
MIRKCKKCGIEKPIEQFFKHSKGYRHTCKVCYCLAVKNWIKRNPSRRLEIVKKSRSKTEVWKKYKNNWKALNGQSTEARAMKWQRFPKWATKEDLWLIREAHSLARLREKVTGFKWHVDHIIPLRGKMVSGLHLPSNIQVIPAVMNMKKNNHFQLAVLT